MERIVVGVDGSEAARAALRWAVEEAHVRGAMIEAVFAWHQPFVTGYAYLGETDLGDYEQEAREILDAAVDAIEAGGIAIDRKLVAESPASALVEESKGAAMLVVGSRGRGGFSGLLLGSVSQQVAHHALCPVVIIPPAV